MPLILYNTLTKREEAFVPLEPGTVRMYSCGPTVYSRPHIGNYASFLLADLLRRWLQVSGSQVLHVKNITDVGHLVADQDEGEDKIEREARREQVDPLEVARKYTEQYLEDEKALNMLEPFARPRATETIPQMIAMIERLLASGHAYETQDGVYFAVQSFPAYGQLSGNTLENLVAGARVSVKEQKRHPADFALWKKCVGENAAHILRWPSPWGEGFPGWHIECSAMSTRFLGEQIDIHTGGEDNIFPHHECEIAQSESANGQRPFVRVWIHRRRIDLGAQKMSKSLGNVLTIPVIRECGFDPLDLRYYLLSVHYRTKLRFTWKGLMAAQKARRRVLEWMREVSTWKPSDAGVSFEEARAWQEKFTQAMESDLTTPAARAALFDCISWSRGQARWTTPALEALMEFVACARETFGCFEASQEAAIPSDVQELLRERERARAARDFARADALRAQIQGRGFAVRDTPEGQRSEKM